MTINIIIICFAILQILLMILLYLFVVRKAFPYLDKKNELKEKEIKNEKYKIFLAADTENMTKELDEYFQKAINKYIIYKFVSKKISYIGADDLETMIKDLTKSIVIDISELYVFYISMTASISNQEDLVRYIRDKIKVISIDMVSNYNRSEEIVGI